MRPLETSGLRILIVEDDELVLTLVRTRLDLAGYQTFIARDGFQALEAIPQVRPSAMLLDINMPRLDGFQVLEKLGASGALARLPTMVLTARNRTDDITRAIGLGAKDYLSKPFDSEHLLQRVARLTRRSVRVQPAQAPAPPPPGARTFEL